MKVLQRVRPALASLILGVVAFTGTTPAAQTQPAAAEEAHVGHQHETSAASQPWGVEWRSVTHFGCPFLWTGPYLVYVPGTTLLRCYGCGQAFSVYFPF